MLAQLTVFGLSKRDLDAYNQNEYLWGRLRSTGRDTIDAMVTFHTSIVAQHDMQVIAKLKQPFLTNKKELHFPLTQVWQRVKLRSFESLFVFAHARPCSMGTRLSATSPLRTRQIRPWPLTRPHSTTLTRSSWTASPVRPRPPPPLAAPTGGVARAEVVARARLTW